MSPRTQWIGFAVLMILCLGTGGWGSLATMPEIDTWYRTIAKPAWTPADWIFGPVWTALYILMAIAAWLVWKPAGFRAATTELLLFAVQLILNVAWSWIFFGLHRPGWALGEIVVLWLAIGATMVAFSRRSRVAAWLLAPYLAWVSFAVILNATIWRMSTG